MSNKHGWIGPGASLLGLALLGLLGYGCSKNPASPVDHYTVSKVQSLSDQPSWVSVPLQHQRRVRLQGTAPPPVTSLSKDFNGTSIGASSSIWFTSVLKYSGPTSQAVTIVIDSSNITFASGGTNYSISVPRSIVTLSPTSTSAVTTFDQNMNAWLTTAPFGMGGNLFMSAAGFRPGTALPGGIKGVAWTARVTCDNPGVSLQWKWAAAVYGSLPGDCNALGVKATDDTHNNAYLNGDRAGTPERVKANLLAGALGGGGSNYTGDYSGSVTTSPTVASGSFRTFALSAATGGTFAFDRYTVRFPPGAVSADAQITIMVPNNTVVGCDLSISPNSLNGFAVPVGLVMNCQNTNVTPSNIGGLSIYWQVQPDVWTNVGGSVDSTALTVSASLPHFSKYRAGW